jgi:hypothetical protein
MTECYSLYKVESRICTRVDEQAALYIFVNNDDVCYKRIMTLGVFYIPRLNA